MSGKFITFEGIEGCGKSTQIKLLDEHLRKNGFNTVLTREPGGTIIGDNIRKVLLDPANKQMHPVTELLLYAASRRQHIEEIIKPAIAAGKIVLCDRYNDSTTAYQGAARKLDNQLLKEVDKIATGGLKPDLTFLLDIETKAGLARAKSRGKLDRFEQENIEFHERVRKGYLEIAKREPGRFFVINGANSIEQIHSEILNIVNVQCPNPNDQGNPKSQISKLP